MRFLVRLLISALVAYGLSYWLAGIHINSFFTAVGFSLILALVNALIKPILVILTLPVTVFTLGLFLLVINALMVLLVDKMMDGVSIDGFGWALLFSLLLSATSSLIFSLLEKEEE